MSPLLVVVGAVGYVVTVVLIALVVRRLLGVRVSLLRTALATLLAVWIVRPLLGALVGEPVIGTTTISLAAGLYLSLMVASTFVLSMVIIVAAEMLVPDGTFPGPLEAWRSWRSRLGRADRYMEIVRIATRHGLARFVQGRRHLDIATPDERRELARSLRRALEDAGVTFVKLGQQLSTRGDLLPPEFVAELSRLQDDAAPVAWPGIRDEIRAATGTDLAAVFSEIDDEPLAAASVAQVHAARLRSGREVVVKVRRPGVAAVVEKDLDILDRLARTLDARTSWGRDLGVRELAAGFAAALREEMDFTIERDNMRAVAGALEHAGTEGIVVPSPVVGLSTSTVLVMDRLAGIPLSTAGPLLARLGAQRRHEIARTLLTTVLDQLLESGVFHVDLHPGNVLVADDGTLGMLDLGSVGRLGAKTRRAMGQFLASVGTGDSMAASDALLELVDRPESIDERELEQALGVLILRFTGGAATPGAGAAAFTSLFGLVSAFGLGVPPEVAAVFRAMATLEGTLRAIDPEYDLVAEAKAMGRSRIVGLTSPGQLKDTIEREVSTLVPILRRLPRRVDRLADAAEHGRLSFNVRIFADPRDRHIVTNLLNRTLLTVLAATAGLMSVVLFSIDRGPMLTGEASIYTVLATALFLVAVVLALRVLIIILKREEPEQE